MVVISFPEPEMRLPLGEVSTRVRSRPTHSQTASAATYKHTHFTPVYDHSELLLSLVVGIVRQNSRSMVRSVLDRSLELAEGLKMPRLEVQDYT